jgi:DNA polymerase/3'-5' exonuclease PolX
VRKFELPVRVPHELFGRILSENDLVIVMLEHIDYLLKIRGESSSYGYAAYSISKLKEPLSRLRSNLVEVPGVGRFTEKVILEILDSGGSSYYRRLMRSI